MKAAMGKRARLMRRRQWALGAGATVVVGAAMLLGWLDRAEWVTRDWRARWFDRWSPPPSPEIVIIGIDDRALREVQTWPWHRAILAEAVRELARAGAKVVALDVLLDDPQGARPLFDSADAAGDPSVVDGDKTLGAAVAEHGSVVAAARFGYRVDEPGEGEAWAPSLSSVLFLLDHDPTIDGMDERAAVTAVIRGLAQGAAAGGSFRPDRMRIARLLVQTKSIRRAARASSMPPPGRGFAWAKAAACVPPVEPLVQGAAIIANVSLDTPDPGGVVRRVPLLVEYDGRLWPTLGLAAAARLAGAPIEKMRIERRGNGAEIVLPLGNAEERRLPTWPGRVDGSRVDGVHAIAWPHGGGAWLGQFSTPSRPGEVSIAAVLEPMLIARGVRHNLAQLDELVGISLKTDEQALASYTSRSAALRSLAVDDPRWDEAFAQQEETARQVAANAAEFLRFTGEPDPAMLSPEDRRTLETYQALATGIPALIDECTGASGRIAAARARLHGLVNNRLCLIGWTATSSVGVADKVNTSLAPQTPGVYIHAAVANSVLTGFVRRPIGAWAALACVAAMGLAGTAIGTRVRVELGPVAVAAAVGGWFLICGVALWDAVWLVAPVVGPSLGASSAWLSVMLHRLLVEQRARRRTEERFRSYVSPAVVDILVENPELDSMAPQRRELTVMFSDLVGFTGAAERMGTARTGEVLARYLVAMTEALQSHGATIDKYLGDGIMAFWGAPIEDRGHARNACLSVLEMQRRLGELNRAGEFGEAGPLSMRVGLAAGELMVGDFGNPPRNSSYTVLGDASNLASRLESANRRLGTSILASACVRELAGDGFVWRKIGRVVVPGRREAGEVFELMGAAEPAGGIPGPLVTGSG